MIPIICSASVPLYLYLSSPEHVLMKGYKEIRKLENLKIENEDWDILKEELCNVPPDVQTAVIAGHSAVLLSTIPNLKQGTIIDDKEMFSFLRETSRNYFYQVVTPQFSQKTDLLIISRMPRENQHRKHKMTWFLIPVSICIGVFEVFCIIAIIAISRTISHSIFILEKDTEKIASGDLDFDLEADSEKNHHTSNEITSLRQNLNKMRISLKEETERRTRFIMGISHDLRTPVALIRGYTEAITDGVVTEPEEVKKSLAVIGSKTQQLQSMIDELINFVKLDSRQWRKQLLPHDISVLIRDFAKGAEMTGNVYNRTISVAISLRDKIIVPVDTMLFNRVLENIFSNALRYTKINDSIAITADEKDNVVSISIADSGIGIEKEDLPNIFDLFYRGTNSRREEGMGIGLAVVKNIVDTHGWRIFADSKKGEGTCFTIEIPV